jgi:anti-anti-sigma factor
MQLRVLMYQQPSSVVLGLSGALTRHTVTTMEDALVQALGPVGHRLVLDLGLLDECDSAGAAALLGIHRMSEQRFGETMLACPSPVIRSWLRFAAFSEVPVYRTAAAADLADANDRLDPLTVARSPIRRSGRSRFAGCPRPANAADAVYTRPGSPMTNRNRPAR